MESLSTGLSSFHAFQTHSKTPKPNSNFTRFPPNSIPTSTSFNSNQTNLLSSMKKPPLPPQLKPLIHKPNPPHYSQLLQFNPQNLKPPSFLNVSLKSVLPFLSTGLFFPLSCFASDSSVPIEEVSNRINLESILIAIDDFNNRNPFFVAGVTFIWLVVIPLTEEYLQKYKFTSAIDAFRKLRDDPNAQLLDIRDSKTLRYLGSPNLKILNKGVVQVEFREGDEEGFVKMVLEKFAEPANTVVCVMDNFDGNSMKVAELLFKNGFKEAYAIRGGVRGKKGWQEIQESLLPPSVHIYPRKKVNKMSEQLEMNGRPAELKLSLPIHGQSYVNNAIETTPHVENDSKSVS